MFDLWIGWPRWARAGIALAILVYPTCLLIQGVIWPWGWAIGGTLLVLAFPRPLGPRPTRNNIRRLRRSALERYAASGDQSHFPASSCRNTYGRMPPFR